VRERVEARQPLSSQEWEAFESDVAWLVQELGAHQAAAAQVGP